MSLARKLSLVTGSTSGIGLGIAKSFAKAGSDLIINGFGSSSEIESVMRSITDEFKVKVSYDGADMSKVDEIEAMMRKAQTINKGIDVLVNNAGIQYVAPVDSFPVDKWNQILAINLTGVFHTTRLVIPSMKQKNWGRVINIASVHGLIGSADKSAYVAAKHGVVGFTKVLALETAKTGITANCICPGWVLTPLVQKQISDRAEALKIPFDEAKSRLLLEKQPSGGFVTPSQLGDLALFLASDSASEVRGVAWAMDGAWTAQ
jgi:3-hydroxybutyrate dehydrogenase